MNIEDALARTPVATLDLSRYVTVSIATSVRDTVDTMAAAGRSCACVLDDAGRLAGIYTQRDYLQRTCGRPQRWDGVIAAEMSCPVQSVSSDATLDAALAVMNEWWVRNVPVLDDHGMLGGSVSFYSLMATVGNLLDVLIPDEDEAELQHGLTMIDLSGLNHSPPIVVPPETSVANAVQHMRVRGFGSVLVVDERESLIGELTEFDLMTKIGCADVDLHTVTVADYMDDAPRTVRARAKLADVLEQALNGEVSQVPMVVESGRPVGVASVRDIASFVEATITASD